MSVEPARLSSVDSVAKGVVVIVSADKGFREHLRDDLALLRWHVFEAGGGAEGMMIVEAERPEAFLIDNWLPDLEVEEFAAQMATLYSEIDVLRLDGTCVRNTETARSARRHELLHSIREADKTRADTTLKGGPPLFSPQACNHKSVSPMSSFPEMVGESNLMIELAEMIQLVAPRSATVLIEGETGTGKEVVAKAVHRLSERASKPLIVLNCAAIPEPLLEAELFGHTVGAFTGAVASRTGRIETADGGTLFLDEIGEMPLGLQAKMLRFLECGELQQIGSNKTKRVNVRVIAATHRPLEKLAEEGAFRLDLYHRLAVFPLQVPALRQRREDLPLLVRHFLSQMSEAGQVKTITGAAMDRLREHSWLGNVRELMHVLERATILSRTAPEIGVDQIRIRLTSRG